MMWDIVFDMNRILRVGLLWVDSLSGKVIEVVETP